MKKMPTTSMQDTVRPWTWPAKEAYWHSAVAGPGAVDLASKEHRFNNECCSSFAHLILVILSPSPPPPATSGQQCGISAKEDHGACGAPHLPPLLISKSIPTRLIQDSFPIPPHSCCCVRKAQSRLSYLETLTTNFALQRHSLSGDVRSNIFQFRILIQLLLLLSGWRARPQRKMMVPALSSAVESWYL